MEKQIKGKAWVPPELIVLVRSKPEEAVLLACKVAGQGGSAGQAGGCNIVGCLPCGGVAGS